MNITIKNTYPFDVYVYSLQKKSIKMLILKSKQTDYVSNRVDKLVFSYKIIEDLNRVIANIDKLLNKNMDKIVEIIEIDNGVSIKHRFLNKIVLSNIYNSECIMCLEHKPDSNNYFQCKYCLNKFLCYNCFEKLQNDNKLSNKCLICFQNYC